MKLLLAITILVVSMISLAVSEESWDTVIFNECMAECKQLTEGSISAAKCDGLHIQTYILEYARTRDNHWFNELSKICPDTAIKLSEMK